jgi:hypothetical protein
MVLDSAITPRIKALSTLLNARHYVRASADFWQFHRSYSTLSSAIWEVFEEVQTAGGDDELDAGLVVLRLDTERSQRVTSAVFGD